MFTYKLINPGERLCQYLYDKAIPAEVWDRLEERHLTITGRAVHFRDYFQEALAINLTRRLMLAAENSRLQYMPTDGGFLSHLEGAIDRWGMYTLKGNGTLVRLIRDCTIAGYHEISPTLRRHMINWSRARHDFCYLCGSLLDYVNDAAANFLTLDHLWPQSHGGDSDEDNLLPACKFCNTAKKRDYPSWAGLGVHAIIIGQNPSTDAKRSLDGTTRFALHNLAAKALAVDERLSLKQAYIKLKPWASEPWVHDENDVGDFFNLGVHISNS